MHANYFVNTGDATAADVRGLIDHAQQAVENGSVALEPEVKLIGRWGDRTLDSVNGKGERERGRPVYATVHRHRHARLLRPRVQLRRRRRRIGAGTKIWHFCHVLPGAVIGERCNLGQNVVVMAGTRIGNNVKIQNNVSIYEGVELEDDVFCGPELRLHQRDESAQPRLAQARVPADAGAARRHHRRQCHDHLRRHARRVRVHRGRRGGAGRRSGLCADGRRAGPRGWAGCASAVYGWMSDGHATCRAAALGTRKRVGCCARLTDLDPRLSCTAVMGSATDRARRSAGSGRRAGAFHMTAPANLLVRPCDRRER